MDSLGKILKQVSLLCRNYPGIYTSAEVVGRAYLLLGNTLGTTEKIRALEDGLHKAEVLKLVLAANEVALTSARADGFKLGMVYRPVERGTCGIATEDQLIPMDFVHELRRVFDKSESGSSAVS